MFALATGQGDGAVCLSLFSFPALFLCSFVLVFQITVLCKDHQLWFVSSALVQLQTGSPAAQRLWGVNSSEGFQQVQFGSVSGSPVHSPAPVCSFQHAAPFVAPDGAKHLHGGSRSVDACRLGLAHFKQAMTRLHYPASAGRCAQ